jgi:hypothetical protein
MLRHGAGIEYRQKNEKSENKSPAIFHSPLVWDMNTGHAHVAGRVKPDILAAKSWEGRCDDGGLDHRAEHARREG